MTRADALKDWDTLRIFLAIARTGSLRAAADSLRVNHATVARALAALEKDLATRLFDRASTGLTLTQPGEEVLLMTEPLEAQMLAIRRRVAGQDDRPSGSVRISLAPVLAYCYMAPVFQQFGLAYPEIDLDTLVTNQISDLERSETDVSIRIAHDVDDNVVGRRLLTLAKTFYAAPAYVARHPDAVATQGEDVQMIGWNEYDAAWLRETPFPKARFRNIFNEAVLQREAVATGMGITILPCYMGDPDPRLQRVPGTDIYPDRSLWLLLHGDLRRTARVRAFVDFTAEAILRDRALFEGHAEDFVGVSGGPNLPG